jgi:hypothetical protein
MRKLLLLAATALSVHSVPAHAWGPTGHRVTGKIAQTYLTPEAQTEISRLLGVESLAEASTWPDFMRSNPSDYWRKGASPWHYITVPLDTTYSTSIAPPEGDAMTALKMFTDQITDETLPIAQRQLALRFTIHLIGDLHQPLHTGKPGDRGGNRVNVMFKDKPTNLHTLWDEDLLEDENLSYTEKAHWLQRRITTDQQVIWADTNPNTWVAESIILRDRIYEGIGPHDRDTLPNLSYDYVYKHRVDVDLRLQQSGVRMAAYLNEVFAK